MQSRYQPLFRLNISFLTIPSIPFFNLYSFYHLGISRASRHKRRLTGGRVNVHQKKRKHEMGRPPAMTKLDHAKGKTVHAVRGRGGNLKFRAIRLNQGNFAWSTESFTSKARIIDVVYNASNNELERTKTLVKNCVVQIDASPFRAWFEKKYATVLSKKGTLETVKRSEHAASRLKLRQKDTQLAQNLKDQFLGGRLYAVVSSRPGQVGRADGYILEGKELDFYLRKINQK